MEIFKKILEGLGKNLSLVLIMLFDSLESLVGLANRILDRKERKEKEEKEKKKDDDLKDVCDNGTLDDLINKKIGIFVIFLGVFLSGCMTKTQEINVVSTRPWEGHYKNVQDFYEATRDVKLEDGESIWVLSNKTLYSILKERHGN